MHYDPEVRKRWKHLCGKLLMLSVTALLHFRQAARLGLIPYDDYENYLKNPEKMKDKKKKPGTSSQLHKPSATDTYQNQLQAQCPHREFKRHGNKHGSFATCVTCKARWVWVGTGWKLHGCS